MIDKTEIQADEVDARIVAESAADSMAGSAEVSENAKVRGGAGRFALFLSVLALFFTAAGVAAGYKHWQRMNDKARANQAEIAALKEKLTGLPTQEAFTGLSKDVEDKVQQAQQQNTQTVQEMRRLQNQTRQFAETVAVQVGQVTQLQGRLQASAKPVTAKEWQVAEVEFLLQLANRELHLSRDIAAAEAALKEADEILAEVGAVSYLPVRQQIARDLAALEGFAAPDVAAISQQITAMMLNLKPLPAIDISTGKGAPVPFNPEAAEVAAEEEGSSTWTKYKQKVLSTLNDAVVIRKFDKPIQADLDADARQNLYNLLLLRLETLRLQALRGMNAAFHSQLELLRSTVELYYPEQQASVVQTELAKLDKINLEPPLPDISGSLRQLEGARHAEAGVKAASSASSSGDKGGKDE